MNANAQNKIYTTDGIPLEVSLKKVERRNKIKAFFLGSTLIDFSFGDIHLANT